MASIQSLLQTPGNTASVMDVPATPDVDVVEGLTTGIYFVATKWLGPIAQDVVEWAATVLIVQAVRRFEKEFRGVGVDIIAAYNDLQRILIGAAAAYAVPLQGVLDPSPDSISALIATLGSL